MAFKKLGIAFEAFFIKCLTKLHYVPNPPIPIARDISSYAIVFIGFLGFVFSLFVIGKATMLSCIIALCNIIRSMFVLHRDNVILAEQHFKDKGVKPEKFDKSPYDYLLYFAIFAIITTLISGIVGIVGFCVEVPELEDVFGGIVGFNIFLSYINNFILDVSKIFRAKAVFKH